MKRQYSFNQISQTPLSQLDYQNKPLPQPYYTGTKQQKQSWTDIRVQQIKKKYQTPSHRKITSTYGITQKNKQHHLQSQNNPFASYRNALRDSLASPNTIIKKQYRSPSTTTIQLIKQDPNPKIYPTNKQNQQLKQSQNYIDKFNNIKTISKYQQKSNNKYINKYKQLPYNKIDPRVQNIDKINIKIKNILDCLHQNQQYHHIKSNNNPSKQQLTNSYLQKSTNKNTNNDHFHQTKIISRQKFIPQQHLTTPTMKSSLSINQKYSDNYSLTPQTKQSNLSKYKLQQKYNNIKNSQTFPQNPPSHLLPQPQKSPQSWFQHPKISRNRSKSCLTKKNYNITSQQEYNDNNKKLDNQIIKITTRIKQFQEQKKQLNIQFTPYHFQTKSNKSTTHLNQNVTYRCNLNQQPTPNSTSNKPQSIQTYQKKYNAIHKHYDDESRKKHPLDPKNIINPQSNLPPPTNIQPPKIIQIPIPKQQQQSNEKQSTPQFQLHLYKIDYQQLNQQQISSKSQTQLKKKTQNGIQQRKKKLMNQILTTTLSNQQQIFIDNLLQQVKLDQKLRNAKIWYRDLPDSDKQYQLLKHAQDLGIKIDPTKLQVTQQQDNPFYSIHDNQQSYKILLQNWQNSEQNWHTNFRQQSQQLNKQMLQKLLSQKIDLDKKSFCTIQDLVRFLNIQTGTFYRNRDLILIFRRISNNHHQISSNEFIRHFYL